MPWGHEHRPSYNYGGRQSPRNVYSYSPQFWRHAHPPAKTVVVNRRGGAREDGTDNSMRTAVYVGAGALGLVGVGALIYIIAKK